MDAVESFVPVDGAQLFVRAVGAGRPLVVLHGGPEFDAHYLQPELDALGQCCRLVYYDQRGRGRSTPVSPEDVTIESEIEDLESVRRHVGADSIAVLGHSWGCVLALEYAARCPERIARLVLLNTAPAAAREWDEFVAAWRAQRPDHVRSSLAAVSESAEYAAGDLRADADLYRGVFHNSARTPELVEQIVGRLRAHFTPESVLASRAIEDRLYAQTLESEEYDVLGRLGGFTAPTLVVHAEHDFVPVHMAARIAESIPGARLEVLPDCGHFSYAERPDAVRDVICAFLA
jgi:proline iminopeptidase